jgi:hypothetical protein
VVEALESSGWLLKLGCVVEQTQQAERSDFGEVTAKRFPRMEAISGKLALKPDSQVGSLEWDGEVFVIG